MVLQWRKHRELFIPHLLVGRCISQYSASARPLHDLCTTSSWTSPRAQLLRPLPFGHSAFEYAVVCGLSANELKQDLSAMFNLESKLLQSLRANLVGLLLFIVRFNGQGVHFFRGYFAIRLGYTIILVEILDDSEI